MISHGSIVQGKWKVTSFLAKGGFGYVFQVEEIRSTRRAVIKICDRTSQFHTIEKEKHIYGLLGNYFPSCFPTMYDDGYHGQFPFIVLQQMGESLSENLRNRRHHYYSMRTISRIGVALVDSIQRLHYVGYVHRDIKPGNVLLHSTPGRRASPYLIDFGLCAPYVDSSGYHMAERRGPRCGTVTFAAVRGNEGWTQCRADDMESLIYTLVYLCKGRLPWANERSNRKVAQYKRKMRTHDLFIGLPKEIEKVMRHILSTHFSDVPNYAYIRAKLAALAFK